MATVTITIKDVDNFESLSVQATVEEDSRNEDGASYAIALTNGIMSSMNTVNGDVSAEVTH